MFDDECGWPRRLLHIPSMTSYPWEPGNRYCTYIQPEYFALSYTWGRWRLKDDEAEHVQPLPVKGVTWKIPRVHPSHFTASELEGVLKKLPNLKLQDREDDYLHQYEFVWIDIACIDQTPGSSEMAAEIGRQAKIFRGAAYVFIWLTKLTQSEFLEQWSRFDTDILDQVSDAPLQQRIELQHIATTEIIEFFLCDPWFSSLWTLQEAYLRTDAILLNRECSNFSISLGTTDRLKDLLMWFEMVHDMLRSGEMQTGAGKNYPQQCAVIEKLLDNTGLTALTTPCPVVLLAMAQRRKTGPDNTSDRVYGIMQVFDFRLGKSRPGSDPSHVFTLEELEDELGAALLESYPLMSQLYIHTQPSTVGKGWRVGPHSWKAIHLDSSVYFDLSAQYYPKTVLTQLSTRRVDDILWGHFSGPACSIGLLLTAWIEVSKVNPWRMAVSIGLDCFPEIGSGDVQFQLDTASSVARNHPDSTVVLIGLISDQNIEPRRAIGVILDPYEPKCNTEGQMWRRIGVCTWNLHPWAREDLEGQAIKALLRGDSKDWVTKTGLFG